MSQPSSNRAKSRAVLIQRDNELSEFTDLLADLEFPVDVFRGSFPTPDQLVESAFAILPARMLIESGSPNLSLWPRTIAVVDNSSKTLLSHLNRLGLSMLIRRPIHPRTLRLLLLHEIYRGPERRGRKRTSIGHAIRTSGGLFKQHATLLELSTTGARVALPNASKVGSNIALLIGKDLTKTKPLKLAGKVVRCIRDSGVDGRSDAEIGIAFLKPAADATAIAAILARFATGPAEWNGVLPSPGDSQSKMKIAVEPVVEIDSPPPEPIDPEASARRLPPIQSCSAAPSANEQMISSAPEELELESLDEDACEVSDSEAGAGAGSDRRSDPRIPYERRVVALGEEAARVLVGRDLS